MSKKAPTLLFILLLVLAVFLSGCGEDRTLSRRVDSMLKGGDEGREAQRLIMNDAQNVYPELLSWLESDDAQKSERAVSALTMLGEDARQYLLQQFSTMSEKARPKAIGILAAPGDKETVLRLISLMRFPDAQEDCVQAIVTMGEPAAEYLAGQLHSTHYSEYIDQVLVAFGETAVPLVVPSLQSENTEKARRAIGILSAMGEPAIPGIVTGLLAHGSSAEAFELAGETLSQYPDVAIPAIFDAVCGGTGTPQNAVSLLSVLSPDYWDDVFSCHPQAENTPLRQQVLSLLTDRITVGSVLDLALSGGSDEALWEGVALGLLGGTDKSDQTMVEILSRIGESTETDALLVRASEQFLPAGRSRDLARSLSAGDMDAFRALAEGQDLTQLEWLGQHLSMVSSNETVYTRCAGSLEGTAESTRQALLTAFASGTDARLPALVISEFSNADDARKQAALIALSQVSNSEGENTGSFDYANFNYAAGLAGWITCLQSANEEIRELAGQVLQRVPTGSVNHGFFVELFNAIPSQYILEVLSDHYWEEDAVTAVFSYPPEGEGQKQIKTIALAVTGSMSGIAAEDAPDVAQTAKGILQTLGFNIAESAEGADLVLDVAYTGRPLSKFYSGMTKTSYPGAQFSLTLRTGDAAGQSVETVCTLSPPNEAPDSSAKEYMPDPGDAPLTDCFNQAFIDGIYQLFGRETLFVLYRDYSNNVLPVAQTLWTAQQAE